MLNNRTAACLESIASSLLVVTYRKALANDSRAIMRM